MPVADVGVIAQTHYGITGGATCIGEQPIKGMVDPKAMARMGLGESLTNLVFANTTGLKDVKYLGQLDVRGEASGDGAHMFDACTALCEAMGELYGHRRRQDSPPCRPAPAARWSRLPVLS